MNDLLALMIDIYDIKDIDWLNYKITKENPLTLHHIIKKEDGGKNIATNLAPITKKGHCYLHIIEHYDINAYNKINSILLSINQSGNSKQKQREIEAIFLAFEEEHSKDVIKGNKGKSKRKTLTYTRKKDQNGK